MGEDAGRRPKPVRVREANARILRAIYQPNMDAMFIESQPAMRRINGSPPAPRRIELCAGRGRKENVAAAQGGTCFPNGGPGGKSIPESALRLGRSFRMTHQAETASRNLSSEWDAFSRWRAQRKLRPGICSENGTRFPAGRPALLNSKTCAPSIPKLGRRKPKRNRRRSI